MDRNDAAVLGGSDMDGSDVGRPDPGGIDERRDTEAGGRGSVVAVLGRGLSTIVEGGLRPVLETALVVEGDDQVAQAMTRARLASPTQEVGPV